MDMNIISTASVTYAQYDTSSKKASDDNTKASEAAATEADGAVYEKSQTEKSATYSINKMSAEDRAALVQQLKDDQTARQNQLIDLVKRMMTGQAETYAKTDDSLWKFLADGNFTVDAETKAQAQADIAEDGYWGITQTSQRLFDFACALAGDDEDKMKEMQEAMAKGFKEATGAWGKDLPELCSNTLDAANKLFEDYYSSKQQIQ